MTEVGIAIGLWPCGGPKGTSKCASTDVSQVLGNVVYAGAYSPQPQTDGRPPQQNFTVTVPASFKSGQVSLGVAHLALVGVSAGLVTSVGVKTDDADYVRCMAGRCVAFLRVR